MECQGLIVHFHSSAILHHSRRKDFSKGWMQLKANLSPPELVLSHRTKEPNGTKIKHVLFQETPASLLQSQRGCREYMGQEGAGEIRQHKYISTEEQRPYRNVSLTYTLLAIKAQD